MTFVPVSDPLLCGAEIFRIKGAYGATGCGGALRDFVPVTPPHPVHRKP